ncbi:ABC transporter permease subunit [Amycolatopsis sp. NPDC005232]|uniref:ABC transporter permease n=1 Tax=unclassified Amycolatopsis TaxID=2618356 RepID=UPI001C69A5B9|nr:ABC transporter permease subunit [Amycolatopsis sp. DSM 110486]QYN18044.1 ABC transporter permease subunit [Amycolatopsis sp. DSM 110486]
MRRLIGFAVPVAVILLWQLVKSAGLLPYDNVPAPSDIWSSTVDLASSGELMTNTGHTLAACLGGWALGSALGLLLGLLLGLVRPAWTYGMASVEVLRALPAISFVPIVVILLAQTVEMEIVIAAWVAIWPVAISTIDGVRGVNPVHQDLARTLGLSPVAKVVKFALPTALPKIIVALRLSLSAALVLAIVAEIVGDPEGIGYALVQSQQSLRPAAMFSYILLTGVLGIVLNFILVWTLRFVPGARQAAGGADDAA